MKDELLKGLDFCYNRPPSKWDPAFVFRFKTKLLPKIITFISGSPDWVDPDAGLVTPEIAKKLFNE